MLIIQVNSKKHDKCVHIFKLIDMYIMFMLLRKIKNYFHNELGTYDATRMNYWWNFKVGITR
jgi:hypothetical protein